MRRAAVLLIAAAVALASCGGDEERPAAPAAPDDPVMSTPAEPAAPAGPATSPKACERLGRRLTGVRVPAASDRAARRGCTLRVAVEDGAPLALTEDYSPQRINVRVRDGVVTGVEFMG